MLGSLHWPSGQVVKKVRFEGGKESKPVLSIISECSFAFTKPVKYHSGTVARIGNFHS